MKIDHSHAHPIGMYLKTFGALLVLMVLTVVMAFVHVGPEHTSVLNNLIAMAIAVTKAVLVVMFFMHVKFSTQLTKFWAILGFLWFLLMFIMFADYTTRPREYIRGWEPAAEDPNAPAAMPQPPAR